MVNKDWTWEDYEYLYRHYNILPVNTIAEKLGRSVSSTVSHAEKLGLFPRSNFSRKDLLTARNYSGQLGTALIFLLPEYSTANIEELMACVENC